MSIVNQKEIDQYKLNPIGKPPRPILSERPGPMFGKEGFYLGRPQITETKMVYVDGEYIVTRKDVV